MKDLENRIGQSTSFIPPSTDNVPVTLSLPAGDVVLVLAFFSLVRRMIIFC